MKLMFVGSDVLLLADPRRFGTLSLSSQPDGCDNAFLKRLGPDFLDPKLTPELFISRCRHHPGLTLKSLLLHQGIAAGLGNIYACEALYRALLNPRRRVSQVSDEQLARLLDAVRQTLQLGIEHGGTTLRDYLDGRGRRGRMKKFLQVYGREGLPSLEGRGQVIRIQQNQRSTWYCPEVQK